MATYMIDNKNLFLLQCPDYEDYLDTLIQKIDLKFISNFHQVRNLVKLGFRSATPVLSPEQFEINKEAAKISINPAKKSVVYFSQYVNLSDPVLLELQSRERPNMNKFLSTILFVVYKLKSGFEISGYIDYEHSLREANRKIEGGIDWLQVFINKKLIKPRVTDLSFYNWKRNQVLSNNSDNYVVLHHPIFNLCFMYRGDRKIISSDPEPHPEIADNCVRTDIYSPRYGYVIFYDHVIRRKL